MKKVIKKGHFFAKAEGSKLTLRQRAEALIKGRKKPEATAKLEIADRATGTVIVFPEIGAVSEIDTDVAVTAEDGQYVFEADGFVYTVDVKDGKVTNVVEDQTGEDVMSADTTAFIEGVAEALETAETFQTDATARIEKLETDLATALSTIKDLRSKISHKSDRDDEDPDKNPKGKIKIGGKDIDLSKINLK